MDYVFAFKNDANLYYRQLREAQVEIIQLKAHLSVLQEDTAEFIKLDIGAVDEASRCFPAVAHLWLI